MEHYATVEKDGVQIKVWVPEGLYDWLRVQAGRKHTSVAAEARRLMNAGMATVESLDDLRDQIRALTRWLDLHLEPLAYAAATDAAFGVEAWRLQLRGAYAETPDEAERVEGTLEQRAVARVQRVLRGESEGDAVEKEVQRNGDSDSN